MTDEQSREERSLVVAERAAIILERLGIESALIGAAALAVHGYPRATADIDLAVCEDPFSTLQIAQRHLREELGAEVEFTMPDADDPLGGVLSIRGDDFHPVQIVNYLNPLRAGTDPGADAVRTAVPDLIERTRLRVVDVPHLVALKLYAGGTKSALDVIELVDRNPEVPLERIREVCARYGLLSDLDRLVGRGAT